MTPQPINMSKCIEAFYENQHLFFEKMEPTPLDAWMKRKRIIHLCKRQSLSFDHYCAWCHENETFIDRNVYTQLLLFSQDL